MWLLFYTQDVPCLFPHLAAQSVVALRSPGDNLEAKTLVASPPVNRAYYFCPALTRLWCRKWWEKYFVYAYTTRAPQLRRSICKQLSALPTWVYFELLENNNCNFIVTQKSA